MHIHQIPRLVLRGKLPPFPHTFHVVVLKRRHQLAFVLRVCTPTLPVTLNILLEISKFKFACKITVRAIRYLCCWFTLLP